VSGAASVPLGRFAVSRRGKVAAAARGRDIAHREVALPRKRRDRIRPVGATGVTVAGAGCVGGRLSLGDAITRTFGSGPSASGASVPCVSWAWPTRPGRPDRRPASPRRAARNRALRSFAGAARKRLRGRRRPESRRGRAAACKRKVVQILPPRLV